MEDGKDFSAFHNMWSLKEKDLARKEKLKRMCLLDRLLAKTEPLSEEEEALKKKLIREMFLVLVETTFKFLVLVLYLQFLVYVTGQKTSGSHV
ncbi:hypothetical protein F2Q69_00032413 [Brassica cretica]|uniref:Uncharacterized protein n=1 Tax=Brassica cretica TaxID=69181 RepID=A0A8S9RTQ2_BRACR|nr:hypothetical protein F2Q69_00032413 [Brassica cretica]